jgi:hypothetical protein
MVLATQSAAILVAVTARLYYGWQNSRKETASAQMTVKDIEWLNCKFLLFKPGDMTFIKPFASYRQRESDFPVSVLVCNRTQKVDQEIAVLSDIKKDPTVDGAAGTAFWPLRGSQRVTFPALNYSKCIVSCKCRSPAIFSKTNCSHLLMRPGR